MGKKEGGGEKNLDVKTIVSFFAPIGNCATNEFVKDNDEINHEVFKSDNENVLGVHDNEEDEIAFLDGPLEDENFFEINDKKGFESERKTKKDFKTKDEPKFKKELQVFHPDIEILNHFETTSYVGSDYVFYEDFNLVDMIFPMNIQGKIFDPGITFHEKSFEKDAFNPGIFDNVLTRKSFLTLDVFDPLHPPLMDFHVTKAFFGFTFSILKFFSKKFVEPGIKNATFKCIPADNVSCGWLIMFLLDQDEIKLGSDDIDCISADEILVFLLEDLLVLDPNKWLSGSLERASDKEELPREQQRGWGKDAKGNTIVHPPVSLDEHVAVQRENKKKRPTYGLSTDSEVLESVESSTGPRPETMLNNLKFLRPLPSSWNWSQLWCEVTAAPLILLSLELLFWLKPTYSVSRRITSISFSESWSSGLTNFDQVDSVGDWRLEEMDLKWQDGLLSLRITGLAEGWSKDDNYNNQSMPDLTEKKIGIRARYSAFKVTDVKTDEPKALVSPVDSMVKLVRQRQKFDWSAVERGISPKIKGEAKKKKEWEVKFEATLARFEKWKESSKNLKNLIDSSMSTRTKVGLGFQEYFGVDEVFDLSTPSVFIRPWLKTGASRPRPKTPTSVDIQTFQSTDLEDPKFTMAVLGFRSIRSCGRSDYVLAEQTKQFHSAVTAGGSDPAASRNRPAVNYVGRPNPTGRVGQGTHHAAAQSNPAGWSKSPAPVSAGRPVSAGWFNPAARPYFRPSSVYFNNMYWPELYDPMYMNEGRWGTAVKTSAASPIRSSQSAVSYTSLVLTEKRRQADRQVELDLRRTITKNTETRGIIEFTPFGRNFGFTLHECAKLVRVVTKSIIRQEDVKKPDEI
ncbi:hypothetical protein Tco_1312819 [Tanacetum coccineum]